MNQIEYKLCSWTVPSKGCWVSRILQPIEKPWTGIVAAYNVFDGLSQHFCEILVSNAGYEPKNLKRSENSGSIGTAQLDHSPQR